MNIKVLDSWLKEYVKTKATPQKIAECLSLTSVSVEKLEKYSTDTLYDIEVTTNRPDLMSVVGLARETAAILPQFGIEATFAAPKLSTPTKPKDKLTIEIKNDPMLVNRICAIIMEVSVKDAPKPIKDRLESSDIRSLNNLIDVTNYVMREIGHPSHVFDYDRLTTKKLIIRQSKKGEQIVTLDKKTHVLPGGDIVADNGEGEIVDLLGVMGTQNSVVTNTTKRILFFLDNNDPHRIRKTSMSLAIRSEAAQLNEKQVDPNLAMDALLRGIELYQRIANGVVVSDIIDIYPNKVKSHTITISKEKIDHVIGVPIPLPKAASMLSKLGFETKTQNDMLTTVVPTWREHDVEGQEDIIEEIARVNGYHNLPSILPPATHLQSYHRDNPFFYEHRVKNALKYWGFTEVYTYSFVSEALYEGPIKDAVTLKNPLTTDFVYMRRTLIPSLLEAVKENKNRDEIKIFELSNVYWKKSSGLPDEIPMLAAVVQSPTITFYKMKGYVEQLLNDLGIKKVKFRAITSGGMGADVLLGKDLIGNIELLEETLINFELNFSLILQHASLRKVFKPLPKYPPVIEDLAIIAEKSIPTGDIMDAIKSQSDIVTQVSLLDQYEDTRTFHVVYQHPEKNLTTKEVGEMREKILTSLKKKFGASIK